MRRFAAAVLVSFAALVFTSSLRSQNSALPPPYHAAQQVSGVIRVWGSPQMGPLLELYERGFHEQQPAVTFQNDLRSTLTAVAGVYTGRADVGMLGRELWATEREAFIAATGHAPTLVPVATGAFDVPKATFALMIFVSKENPVSSLSMSQLARIFSNMGGPARTWGDLGLKGKWARRPIHLYGFTTDNDKSLVFRDLVFPAGRRWSCSLHEFGNVAAGGLDAGEKITRAVAADPDGIGVSNVHYANADIKALPIAEHDGDVPVAPTRAYIAEHKYPLFRSVYAVVDRSPGGLLAPEVSAFLSFMLSQEGAQAVSKEGNYLPLSTGEAEDAARIMQNE